MYHGLPNIYACVWVVLMYKTKYSGTSTVDSPCSHYRVLRLSNLWPQPVPQRPMLPVTKRETCVTGDSGIIGLAQGASGLQHAWPSINIRQPSRYGEKSLSVLATRPVSLLIRSVAWSEQLKLSAVRLR